jgi:hypothetical protein
MEFFSETHLLGPSFLAAYRHRKFEDLWRPNPLRGPWVLFTPIDLPRPRHFSHKLLRHLYVSGRRDDQC